MNKSKKMANLSPFFISSIILILSTLPSTVLAVVHATSTVEKDQVPCTMCWECENPCQPLPPPPPPVIECPPPPPPPSPPPPLPLPPAVYECPPPPPKPTCGPCETLPPPKPPCEDATCLPSLEPPMPWAPQGPPRPPYPPESYYPPGIPFPDESDYGDNNDGGQLMPAVRFLNSDSYSVYFTLQSLTFVALLFCTSCYLFV